MTALKNSAETPLPAHVRDRDIVIDSEGRVFVVLGHIQPSDRILDVGCGTGAMVKTARKLGVDAWGVDILPHDEPYLLRQDLREFCDLGKTFDLVTSIEVAEHIDPASTEILCDTYARHVRIDGGLLVLTTAAPGQNGDGHVTLLDKIIWRDKLEARGLRYDGWATKRLVIMWEQTHWATHWCEQNLQVFHRFEMARS